MYTFTCIIACAFVHTDGKSEQSKTIDNNRSWSCWQNSICLAGLHPRSMCLRFLWQGTRGVANVDPGSGEVASCDLWTEWSDELQHATTSYNYQRHLLQLCSIVLRSLAGSILSKGPCWPRNLTEKTAFSTSPRRRKVNLPSPKSPKSPKSPQAHLVASMIRNFAVWRQLIRSNHHPLTTGNLWQSLGAENSATNLHSLLQILCSRRVRKWFGGSLAKHQPWSVRCRSWL